MMFIKSPYMLFKRVSNMTVLPIPDGYTLTSSRPTASKISLNSFSVFSLPLMVISEKSNQ